ncbi:MAG: DUF4136 domain-containing protein [Cyclobacteriaceae bacterium]|jgi:hypothetical protein|nr:DUF4136 domain-containing protein [Flammeovirgaceae bacterium]
MKAVFMIGLAFLAAGCLGYKELPVEYDYSYRGNFKRYRSFDIMKPIGVSDTTMYNGVIERSILSRMKFLGYRQTDNRPNLLISYKMFGDSLRFNGYIQPDIEEWVKTQNVDLDYDAQRYNLKTGTLLIQFYDRKQNRSVWQGYATTMYGDIDFGNDRHLRNAVISILDKYRFWAEGFVEGAVQETSEAPNK